MTLKLKHTEGKVNLASRKKSRMQWYRVDLHLHTPASADYLDSDTHYIDILRRAEQRGLDIIAFTDHNTVNGYAAMMREIDRLQYLETLGRAQADELRLLAEYRRLLDKILVLPGFEFTATFGFHILGIFSPETPQRDLEHTLLSMNIPSDVLDEGNSDVGASVDVISAYQIINEAGWDLYRGACEHRTWCGNAWHGFRWTNPNRLYTRSPLTCLGSNRFRTWRTTYHTTLLRRYQT